MKSLERIFHYQNKQVRTVQVDGEAWFVAKDVCGVLGIRTNSVRIILDTDEVKQFCPNDNSIDIGTISEAGRGGRDMVVVSEAGLYSLMIRSRKPEAKSFRRWITHEVLPALRKSGSYQMAEAAVDPGTLLHFTRRDLLKLAIDAERECQQLRDAVEDLRPRAAFFDRVADTGVSFSLGETAKMLHFRDYGRNNLIRFLREAGVLMSDNVAKQRYIDRGYFQVVQSDYCAPDGTLRVKAVTRVYERGVNYIKDLLAASTGRPAS